ncbi:MAG: hypothetical protein HYZ18_06770 [Pseudogulbenkiania sp.]|nr:hypothetical protein [Pseudogulbenkiania sp.]
MQHLLRVELASHELLVIELPSVGQVRAVSGTHWLTVDGRDICLAPGETEIIPEGKILAEGHGMLEFTRPQPQLRKRFGLWPLGRPAQGAMLLGKVCF